MSALSVVLTAAVWQNLVLIRFAAPWPLTTIVLSPKRACAVTVAIGIAAVLVSSVYGLVAYAVLLPAGLDLAAGPVVALIMAFGYLTACRLTPFVNARHQTTALALVRLALYNPATFQIVLASGRAAYLAQQPFLFVLVPLAATVGIALAITPIAAIRQRQRNVSIHAHVDADTQVFLALALYSLGLSQVTSFSQKLFVPLW